jgi:transposase
MQRRPAPTLRPDLNPIEQVFAKLKALLRKTDERNIERVSSRIGHILDAFTSTECGNYFRNSAYASI